ncbi:DUF2254 domain-containing protein [Curtobacterium ammoniigenes]|uniref:DUF2254 domain-containing protein n=1 Tax=Curtobacterium ammoniigenes TaxID=395387 RepID=UPI00083543C6|nr:DUF2254 domain-containing protein [Curtobacterium ammoniigenes]
MHGLSLRVRESFWFLPALFGIGAVALAELIVLLDRVLIAHGATQLWFIDALSASGGRSILTTIGTAMLTVAGTSFSITISVLATTSSTYGPRLVRNFMADRANQFVLAAFTSTFLYAIVVLRSVHTAVDGQAFVPVIAIHVAVLLSIADVAILVFFIHHIASSTQITSLQRQVQTDLEDAVREVYRDGTDSDVRVDPVELADGAWVLVGAHEDGYLQSVRWERLREWATSHDTVIDMTAMPGDYVICNDPIFRIAVSAALSAKDRAALVCDASALARAASMIGTARTPYQDVGFALQQLVEIAVRGLASGTNDPYTAVSALDLAATALVPLWRSGQPITAYCDGSRTPRVISHWPEAQTLIGTVFDGVQTYGTEHPIVVAAAVRLAERLEAAAPTARRGALLETIANLRSARG